MINFLDLFGIGDAIVQAFRTLFGYIAAIIYSLIEYLYRLFEILGRAEIVDSQFIQTIYSKVGMILGLFMIFKLTFSLIQSLIDPNKLTDKKNGYGQIIFRSVIAIALLGLTPAIFREAFKLQNYIVGGEARDNVLYKLIVGSNTNGNVQTIGRTMAADLFFGFYTENENHPLDRGMTDEILAPNGDASDFSDRFVEDNYDTLRNNVRGGTKDFYVTVDYLAIKEENEYVIEVNWIPLLLVGGIVLYIIAVYCIQIGIRVVQLAYLQLIAPIPILSYISDPEGTFKRWIKQCTTTYLDIFIRMAIIYFVMSLISDVLAAFKNAGGVLYASTNLADEDSFMQILVVALIIIGLLLFAKKLPELLKDLFPNMGGGAAKFDFGLNAKKQFKDIPLLSSGVKGIGYMGKKAIGVIDRRVHNVPKQRGKFGQFIDKLAPEHAKDVAANRQAKIDEKLRDDRDTRGKYIYDNYRTLKEGKLEFDPEKAFNGRGDSDYIKSYNAVKNAKSEMKKAQTLLNDIDKELTAAYAMPSSNEKQIKERKAAIDYITKRRDAAAKDFGAKESLYNLAKEQHDSMKKMSNYKKFAEIEDDFKYYTDRHKEEVKVPEPYKFPEQTTQSGAQSVQQSSRTQLDNGNTVTPSGIEIVESSLPQQPSRTERERQSSGVSPQDEYTKLINQFNNTTDKAEKEQIKRQLDDFERRQ